jgi:hypothetical protein
MAVYTVLRPSVGVGLEALDRTVFIADKFSWPAFFLGPIWLLYRRLWLALLLTVLAIAALAIVIATGWLRTDAEWIYVAIAALLGFEGARMREAALARRGFMVADVITARNRSEAESLYFRRVAAEPPAPHPNHAAPQPPMGADPHVVGLFPQPKGLP